MKKLFKILIFIIIPVFVFNCKSTVDDVKWKILVKGDWAINEEANVCFSIFDSTIVYFDSNYQYNYKIDDNKKLTILDSNSIILEFKILKISRDSLHIKSLNDGKKNNIFKYYKRK